MGDSFALLLPDDMVHELELALGDRFNVTKVPGGFELHGEGAGHEAQLAVANEVMDRRRNALRELAA